MVETRRKATVKLTVALIPINSRSLAANPKITLAPDPNRLVTLV